MTLRKTEIKPVLKPVTLSGFIAWLRTHEGWSAWNLYLQGRLDETGLLKRCARDQRTENSTTEKTMNVADKAIPTHWFGVYEGSTPWVAFPTMGQAEHYASEFGRPVEIRPMGAMGSPDTTLLDHLADWCDTQGRDVLLRRSKSPDRWRAADGEHDVVEIRQWGEAQHETVREAVERVMAAKGGAHG